MSWIVAVPVMIITRFSSSVSIVSTRATPSGPAAPRPQQMGRPRSTALAPRASALAMSPPRRAPLSSSTGTRPAAASTTSGSTSMAARLKSRMRPPWFDTTRQSAPASMAMRASSGFMIPFTTTGTDTSVLSHVTSSGEDRCTVRGLPSDDSGTRSPSLVGCSVSMVSPTAA